MPPHFMMGQAGGPGGQMPPNMRFPMGPGGPRGMVGGPRGGFQQIPPSGPMMRQQQQRFAASQMGGGPGAKVGVPMSHPSPNGPPHPGMWGGQGGPGVVPGGPGGNVPMSGVAGSPNPNMNVPAMVGSPHGQMHGSPMNPGQFPNWNYPPYPYYVNYYGFEMQESYCMPGYTPLVELA